MVSIWQVIYELTGWPGCAWLSRLSRVTRAVLQRVADVVVGGAVAPCQVEIGVDAGEHPSRAFPAAISKALARISSGDLSRVQLI